MGRYRRYLIGLAIVLVLLGAYAAAGFLAVPYFVRKEAQDFVRTHYKRTLSIGDVRFNPFTLRLDITRVSLPDADGQTLLAFQRLHVALQLATLWRLGPSFREIRLEQPYARVVLRPDGALNLADLAKGFPPSPKPQKPTPPMRLFIQRLAVFDGSVTYEDRTRPTPFRAEFKPFAFELRDFSTRGQTGNGYGLDAASPEGERLTWTGTVHLAPVSSHGVFEVADLKARTVWNYLRASLPFEVAGGTIGIKGDYDLASAGGGPLGLKVNVHNTAVTALGIKPKGGDQNYIDVARIEVNETQVDLNRHSVNVAKVALSGGDIKAWLNEQHRLNLLDLLAPPTPAESPAAAAAGSAPGSSPPAVTPAAAAAGGAPEPPPSLSATATAAKSGGASTWTIAAPDIGLQGFKVSAEDRSLTPAAALLLAPLNIHVAGFNTSPEDTLDVTLESGVNESGKVGAKAKVTPKSGAASAHVEASSVDLTLLQPYISHYTSMTLVRGTLGAKLDVDRQADGTLAVKGNTGVADLRTIDNQLKLDFIKWKNLRVADIRYRSAPASLRVGSVTALEPYVRMVIAPDRTVNIVEILKPSGAARKPAAPDESTTTPPADQQTPPATKPPRKRTKAKSRGEEVQTAAAPAGPLTPFPVAIDAVRFVNASANYADLWIKPSFAIGIQSLSGAVTGLSSDPKSRAKVDLKGKVDRYSPIEIAGEANLLSAALYTDIKMSFQDLDLTVVNPYSGHFAGYKIDKGKLSVQVSYKVEQRKLTATQHFVIDQLELGDRVESPDAVHLPLKIAVALLKDRNGVIDLDLPMTGSLDDPKFRIGPIIWKMVVNLVVKVAASPFALLGHLFGGGHEHMNVVEFDAGSAELDKPAQEQLAALAKALKERPQLKLDVPITYSADVDRPQIAATRLRQELMVRVSNTRAGRRHPDSAGEMALADPEKHFKLLVDQYQTDRGKDAPLPATAVAVQQTKRGETPPYDPAINDLRSALIEHVQVPDSDLEALGKERAIAIQGALVSQQIEAARVFIVLAPAAPKSSTAAPSTPGSDASAQPGADSRQAGGAGAATAPVSGTPTASPAAGTPAGPVPGAPATGSGSNAPTGSEAGGAAGEPASASSEPPPGGKVKVTLALK
jgi:hypothetical protein